MNYTRYEYPHISNKYLYLVSMRDELRGYYSELMQRSIAKYLAQHKKILIVCNKHGHSSGMICTACGEIPQCRQCDIAIAYHQMSDGEMIGLCHICKTQYAKPSVCQHCHSPEVKLYGVGIQQVASWIRSTYSVTPLVIDKKVVSSLKKIQQLGPGLSQASICLTTSVLRTPPVEWMPDLMIIINADQGLQKPHYLAHQDHREQLYDRVVQYPQTPHTIIQTHNPDHPVYRALCVGDRSLRWQQELLQRAEHQYPPHGEMVTLLYKHEVEQKLFTSVNKLYQELLYLKECYGYQGIDVYPTPPLIYKMYAKYHYTIIIKGQQVRNFLDIAYSKLSIGKRGFRVLWEE